jgi:lysocardiolipin and lysophospholipid acyltransferase
MLKLTSTSVGQYGQDIYTLPGTYFRGRRPPSVNMYWRRFRIADLPLDDDKIFGDWVLARWREKDDLLQYFVENNRFPADKGVSPSADGGEPVKGAGWIETEVKPVKWGEWIQVFIPTGALVLVINVLLKMLNIVLKVLRVR